MTYNKFYNIVHFSAMFLSGDIELLKTSPDYYLEKFYKFFGASSNFFKNKIEVNKKVSGFVKYYNEIWDNEDFRINLIYAFLIDIYLTSKSNNLDIIYNNNGRVSSNFTTATNNIKCHPSYYITAFKKWFGDPNLIRDEQYTHIHEIIFRDLIDIYFNSCDKAYPEFFLKLNRQIKLNNILK